MRDSAYRQFAVSQESATDRPWHTLTDSSYGRNKVIHNDNMPQKIENGEKLILMMKKTPTLI